jgi:hypothetical protein
MRRGEGFYREPFDPYYFVSVRKKAKLSSRTDVRDRAFYV